MGLTYNGVTYNNGVGFSDGSGTEENPIPMTGVTITASRTNNNTGSGGNSFLSSLLGNLPGILVGSSYLVNSFRTDPNQQQQQQQVYNPFGNNAQNGGGGNTWLWIIGAVVVLIILVFAIKALTAKK